MRKGVFRRKVAAYVMALVLVMAFVVAMGNIKVETYASENIITLSKEVTDNFSYSIFDCYGMADSAVTIDGVTYQDYIHEPGVTAYASFNPNLAYQAIDYQRDSPWGTTERANRNPEYLLIDLGQVRNIKQINILFKLELVFQYTIEISNDNKDFEIVGLVEEWYSSNDRMDAIVFKNMLTCRYIKIYCRQSVSGDYNIFDVGIYGTEPEELPSVEETSGTQETSSENVTSSVETTTSNKDTDKQFPCKSKVKKLKEMSHRSVKITWRKADGASSYAVYRSNKKNGKYKLIKITSKLKYTDKKVKAGKKYFYRIKATNASGNSTMSEAKKIKVKGMPKIPSIKVNKNSTSWSIVWGTITDNSKGIEIYMKNGQGKYKKFTLINTTTKLKKSKKKKGVTGITSSVDTLQSGVTYKFKARTYAVVKGKKVYSKWSKVKTLKK